MDCQDVNFDHHQHYLNTRRMARQRAAEMDAQSKQVDMDGLSHQQKLEQLKQRNGEEWYQKHRVRLENPDVWEHYLSLN